MIALVASPFALVGFGLWASSDAWEFEGRGFRYWLLVKGSTLEELGLVSAAPAPARYVIRLEEGTDPGSRAVDYESSALPADVIATYAGRCRTMGLTIRKDIADTRTGELVCAGATHVSLSDDVWVSAQRKEGAATAHVSVTTGPGLTATYDFKK